MQLKGNAKALKKLREKDWHVGRMLPDVREISERAYGAPQLSLIGSEHALAATEIWQLSSQQALGGIVQSIGIPAMDIFKLIVKEFKIDPARDVVRKLEEAYGTLSQALREMNKSRKPNGGEAMEVAAEAGVTHGLQFVTAIPVAGFVVRLAWNIGKLIYNISVLAKKAKQYGPVESEYPASRFDPMLDNVLLNRGFLDQIRLKNDWTNMFSPPSLGQGIGLLPDYVAKKLEGGGREIFRTLGKDEDFRDLDWASQGWTGMVPGTAMVHSGIRVKGKQVEELGNSLFPSGRGVGTWVWKQIAAPNPMAALFTIDADVLAGRWQGYIHDLHLYIDQDAPLSNDDKARVMDYYNEDSKDDPIFGWGTSIAPVEHEWEDYSPTKLLSKIRKRQLKACDTLLIAYVTPEFGAFKDPGVKWKFENRRRDLLDHPDRCLIDLDNVIDRDYRDALKSRGVGSMQCKLLPPRFAQKPPEKFKDDKDTGKGGLGGVGGLAIAPEEQSAFRRFVEALALSGLGSLYSTGRWIAER